MTTNSSHIEEDNNNKKLRSEGSKNKTDLANIRMDNEFYGLDQEDEHDNLHDSNNAASIYRNQS